MRQWESTRHGVGEDTDRVRERPHREPMRETVREHTAHDNRDHIERQSDRDHRETEW